MFPCRLILRSRVAADKQSVTFKVLARLCRIHPCLCLGAFPLSIGVIYAVLYQPQRPLCYAKPKTRQTPLRPRPKVYVMLQIEPPSLVGVGVSTLELLRLDETLSRFTSDFRIFPNVLPVLRPLPTLLPPALARPVAPPTSPVYPAVERRMFSRAT